MNLRNLVPALLALAVVAPASASVSPASEEQEATFHRTAFFPTQSLGNRGTDVKAIQFLLGHHLGADCLLVVGGNFGASTETCVKDFQGLSGFPETGVVDEQTWERLTFMVLSEGSSGDAVRAVQAWLKEKRFENFVITVFGITIHDERGEYGPLTTAAVRRFQTHAGIVPTGRVDSTTWRALAWHYELPDRAPAALCSYRTSATIWGTSAAIGQLEEAAAQFHLQTGKPLRLGNVSLPHGGDTPGHATHEVGLDADIRLVSSSSQACSRNVYYCAREITGKCTVDANGNVVLNPDYDWSGQDIQIHKILDAAPGHVKTILFNDVTMQAHFNTHPGHVGRLQSAPGHDQHIHVRYCEVEHPNPTYVC